MITFSFFDVVWLDAVLLPASPLVEMTLKYVGVFDHLQRRAPTHVTKRKV
jgi:hypothetical protein